MADEGVVDPVNDEDTKIERGELRAHVHAPARLGTELGLQDWYRGVYESKSNTIYNAADNEVCATESCRLQNRADQTNDGSNSHALATAQFLAYKGSCHGTKKGADWQQSQ
jgi:hypothetical protein